MPMNGECTTSGDIYFRLAQSKKKNIRETFEKNSLLKLCILFLIKAGSTRSMALQ